MIQRIVGAVDPAKIILFDSYAYETPHPESDVDILVIQTTDLPCHKRSAVIHGALAGLLIPKDIVVYTQAEADERNDIPQAFVTRILKKGVVVYDYELILFRHGARKAAGISLQHKTACLTQQSFF